MRASFHASYEREWLILLTSRTSQSGRSTGFTSGREAPLGDGPSMRIHMPPKKVKNTHRERLFTQEKNSEQPRISALLSQVQLWMKTSCHSSPQGLLLLVLRECKLSLIELLVGKLIVSLSWMALHSKLLVADTNLPWPTARQRVHTAVLPQKHASHRQAMASPHRKPENNH